MLIKLLVLTALLSETWCLGGQNLLVDWNSNWSAEIYSDLGVLHSYITPHLRCPVMLK